MPSPTGPQNAARGRRTGVVLALVCPASLALSAGAAQSNAECAIVHDDARRLECYDLAWRKTVAAPPAKGDWRVRVETSRLDDSKNVFISLTSTNTQSKRFGGEEAGTLFIACRENTTSLFFIFGGNFMADNAGGGRITYRIDDRKAQSRGFLESTDHEALGLWSGGTAIPFLKQVFGAKTLLIRAVPLSESALTYDYAVADLEEAIAPLREACHW